MKRSAWVEGFGANITQVGQVFAHIDPVVLHGRHLALAGAADVHCDRRTVRIIRRNVKALVLRPGFARYEAHDGRAAHRRLQLLTAAGILFDQDALDGSLVDPSILGGEGDTDFLFISGGNETTSYRILDVNDNRTGRLSWQELD